MVGYGPEDTHFVIELTYNYGVKSYEKGNDFVGITVKSREALERAKAQNWPILPGNVLEAPGGYKFFVLDEPQPTNRGKDLIMNDFFCYRRDFRFNSRCRSRRKSDFSEQQLVEFDQILE